MQPLKNHIKKCPKAELPWQMKMQVIPRNKKPHWWQWASGWASGEDNGQNKKELSYSWDWERLTKEEGTYLFRSAMEGLAHCSFFAASPAFGHLHQSGCFSREECGTVRRTGALSQMEWAPSGLFLSSSMTLGSSPWNGGMTVLISWIYCIKKIGRECIS